MGLDLVGRGASDQRYWSVNHVGWARILNLAERYGWHPMGTVEPEWEGEPDAPPWHGSYSSNDGQRVLAADAANLAAALARALPDLPDRSDEEAAATARRAQRIIETLCPDEHTTVIEKHATGAVRVTLSDNDSRRLQLLLEPPVDPLELFGRSGRKHLVDLIQFIREVKEFWIV